MVRGAVKVDGKMQDEATVKQANVIIELAKKIKKKRTLNYQRIFLSIYLDAYITYKL